VGIDYHFRHKGTLADNRFLFPAAILLPGWAVYTLFWIVPQPAVTTVALLVLAFSLPMLAAGRWVRGWQPAYQWPLYLVAYGTAVCATVLLLGDRPFLIGVLLFNAGLAVLSTYLFRQRWWFIVAAICLPWAAWLVLEQANLWQADYYGWTLMGLGTLYLVWAYALQQANLYKYSQPLLAAMLVTVALGVVFASSSLWGLLLGYTLAALLWGVTAVWRREPILMFAVAPLLAGAYWSALVLLDLPQPIAWLAVWPGIVALLAAGRYLDNLWGIEPKAGQPKQLGRFPWYQSWHWPGAIWQRLRRCWGLPFDLTALANTFLYTIWLPAVYLFDDFEYWRMALTFGLGTAVYTYALFRYRIRGLLLVAWSWLQFTYITILAWLFPSPDSLAAVALAFMPMTMATAAMGLLVQFLREEVAPFGYGLKQWWFGWSRTFFAILAINLAISHLMTADNDGSSIIVTLLNALLIGILATLWQTGWLVYIPLALGWLASWQYLEWLNLPRLALPTAYAIISALYGITGYAFLYWQQNEERELNSSQMDPSSPLAPHPSLLTLWQQPLRRAAWILSAITLLYTLGLGGGVLVTLPFAIFDLPIITARAVAQANMLVQVFAILGLFYLAAAVVERRRWLGYGSIWLMLSAWSLWLLYVQGQTELQLYALPASIYLFAVGWLEWTYGSRNLASWIEIDGMLVLFG
jgi:hypothetical protein